MPSAPPFRAPSGTHDVLPPESARWQALVGRFATLAGRAGYGLVVNPTFEEIGVFQRVGEGTDVVRKEMYAFEDRGGRALALRPEGTASVVRAYVQHRPTAPWKVWYAAPSFRYERPQAGRYRQHHQLGVEVLGSDDAEVDVEVIVLAAELYRSLGLGQVSLALNSIGDGVCRPTYLRVLRSYLDDRAGQLCGEHRLRAADQPLRVLDCKRPECRAATASAPRMLDHLCEPCATHFSLVRRGLGALGIAYHLESRLVRGFDYYTRTTFEFAATALQGAQNAVGGGGRYDGLVEELGGPPTPGIGFGIGIERVLLACDAEGVLAPPGATVDVWVVDAVGGTAARDLSWSLRRAGVATDRAFDERSMRAQMKLADRSGARLALIVGAEEAAADTVSLRHLRGPEGAQEAVARSHVVARVKELLA